MNFRVKNRIYLSEGNDRNDDKQNIHEHVKPVTIGLSTFTTNERMGGGKEKVKVAYVTTTTKP